MARKVESYERIPTFLYHSPSRFWKDPAQNPNAWMWTFGSSEKSKTAFCGQHKSKLPLFQHLVDGIPGSHTYTHPKKLQPGSGHHSASPAQGSRSLGLETGWVWGCRLLDSGRKPCCLPPPHHPPPRPRRLRTLPGSTN